MATFRQRRFNPSCRHGARALCGLLLAVSATAAQAGDRVLATWGVTQVEGAAGGGLTPWALIAGSGSRNQIGATASATHWRSDGGYDLRTLGAAVGLWDTVELSYANWRSHSVPEIGTE